MFDTYEKFVEAFGQPVRGEMKLEQDRLNTLWAERRVTESVVVRRMKEVWAVNQ